MKELKSRLGVSHADAQKVYRNIKKISDIPITASRVKGLARGTLKKYARMAKVAKLPKKLRTPKPGTGRELLDVSSGGGELWHQVSTFYGNDVDMKLRGLGNKIQVSVYYTVYADADVKRKTRSFNFTTTVEDFWTDYHSQMRDIIEDGPDGSDNAFNVLGISAAPV